jgi:hypothetical protein
MSGAFVRESDDQWLHDIQPTLHALVVYLTRENNGVRVYEQKNYSGPGWSAGSCNEQWFIVR